MKVGINWSIVIYLNSVENVKGIIKISLHSNHWCVKNNRWLKWNKLNWIEDQIQLIYLISYHYGNQRNRCYRLALKWKRMETFIFIWIQFMIKGIIDISLHYNNKCLKQYFSIKHIRRLKWNGFDGIEHQIHYYIPFCTIMEAKGAIILLFIWIQFRIWMEQLRFRYIYSIPKFVWKQ